jgi:DNA polymerase-1
MPQKQLCLVDASSYVFRAYHAIRALTNETGMATNALFGYINMLLKAMRDLDPSHVAVVLDSVAPSFRKTLYPEYKANRPPVPPDLKEQLPYVERITVALGLPCVRSEGFEADDVIATLARRAEAAGLAVVIVSSDKDLMQLVGPGIGMFDTMKDLRIGPEQVVEKFGVRPEQLGDLLAIMGDSSDNVPGVKGIGPKGAARLLAQFGSLRKILDSVDSVASKREQQALRDHRDAAILSRQLVELRTDVPGFEAVDTLKPGPRDVAALRELFTFLGFRSFLRQLLPGSMEEALPLPLPLPQPGSPRGREPGAPAPVAVHAGGHMPEPVVVRTPQQLSELAAAIAKARIVSLDTETTSVNPVAASLVGISACIDPGRVFYVPVAHRGPSAGEQLPLDTIRSVLGPVIADPAVGKIGQHFKYDTVVLWKHGFEVAGLAFDTMLASYVLDPGRTSHSLDNLAAELLGIKTITYKEVTTKSGLEVRFDMVPVADAARYSGEDAWATLLLRDVLQPRVAAAGLDALLRDVELPLSDVLARMELAGIAIDTAALAALSQDFSARMAQTEREIYGLAGGEFNINSPRQLGEVLFDRLGLPVVRKTKTGPSTDQAVLEELAPAHPLPERILAYRTLAKLCSTYVDVLPTLVLPSTGRIHASFNQAVASTGRLSSSEPNLQNIPVRGEEGKKIRRAFVPAPGRVFISADYSQVELRVLAHLSRDPALSQAFRRGDDIHSRTAAEMFQVLPGMVTPDMRRVAKTINFGVIYGMSAHRLSRDQKIPFGQAKAFIEAYFARYGGIRTYLDACVREGLEQGYVETLLKRRRYLPELKASNHQVRSMGERMAINTPVQGGAADIVKLAMVKLDRRIKEVGPAATLILQVHDELLVEVDADRAEEVAGMVRQCMEEAFPLDVPLKVDMATGSNWADVHG